MPIQEVKLPSTFSITLEDGTEMKRFIKQQYCFSTGFSDIDEFFELDELIDEKPFGERKIVITTDVYDYSLYKDHIEYGDTIIPIDENSLSNIMENEKIIRDLPIEYREYEDEILKVIFGGLNHDAVNIFLHIKALNTCLTRSFSLSYLKQTVSTYDSLIEFYRNIFIDLRCTTVFSFDSRYVFINGAIDPSVYMFGNKKSYYVLSKNGINERVLSKNIDTRLERLIKDNKLEDNYTFPTSTKHA